MTSPAALAPMLPLSRISRVEATLSESRSRVGTSNREGKMVNSSGEVMNMVVISTSSEMEMLTQSMMSRKNVGSGTSMTKRMMTTPAARATSPCLEKRL